MANERQMRMAKAGEELTAKAAAKLRRKFPRMFEVLLGDPEMTKVHPKSDVKNGQWMCADCGEVFQNNFEAWGHSSSHRMVWWTGERFEEA